MTTDIPPSTVDVEAIVEQVLSDWPKNPLGFVPDVTIGDAIVEAAPLIEAAVRAQIAAEISKDPDLYVIAGKTTDMARVAADWDGEVHTDIDSARKALAECREAGYDGYHIYALIPVDELTEAAPLNEQAVRKQIETEKNVEWAVVKMPDEVLGRGYPDRKTALDQAIPEEGYHAAYRAVGPWRPATTGSETNE